MINKNNQSNQNYKKSLYSNLLVACIASECKDVDAVIHPKLVAKTDVNVKKDSLNQSQQTFIMRWNPEISNHKIADFEHAMEGFHDENFYYDWSISDYEKVRVGDRFYMLKVGNCNTGIVMSGVIVGQPYKDEDWSGQGRDVHYVRMMPECMVHPDNSRMITLQALNEALPGVNWNEGHSGVLLNEEQACKFDELWQNFMNCG